jgi:phosphatidylglycerophosphate synthase
VTRGSGGAAFALTAQSGLFVVLGIAVGLGGPGWTVGLTCAAAIYAVIARSVVRGAVTALSPADLVTLSRATITCSVAGLVADSFVGAVPVATLVSLAALALLLDAVDGWVARRTRTSSVFGARCDGEVDAFLLLVLSVYVAGVIGAWVLAIGAARYVFAVAGWGLPWLRRLLPHRQWRKVVCAAQGVVLTVAAAGVLPRSWATLILVVALAMLAESFGRDTWWLWSRRHAAATSRQGAFAGLPDSVALPAHPVAAGRGRTVPAASTDVLALLLVWFALVAPNQAHELTAGAFLRIPAEGLVVAGLALVLPVRARRAMGVVVGVLLAGLTLLKVLDMGFFAAFDRPFDLVSDRGYLGPAVDLVSETYGALGATLAVASAALLTLALFVCLPLATRRLTGMVADHRGRSAYVLTAAATVWVVSAMVGAQTGQPAPIASASAGRLTVDRVQAIAAGIRDQQTFEAAAADDDFGWRTQDGRMLGGLRGKDVLFVFIESYGRTALQESPATRRVRDLLDTGTSRLREAGYSSRSAYLTSPTFGGFSWLAHATLQSGLWVDSEPRYDEVLSGDRMTLSSAFGSAGWRTVAAVPQNHVPWPEGQRFYRLDAVHDWAAFDYTGPSFGWADVPDQFTLSTFHELELQRTDRDPVMAEIDLVSSHAPWAVIPRMVGWDGLGDGSVYWRIHELAQAERDLWRDPANVGAAYLRAITYSLRSLLGYVEKYGGDDLVLVVLGDHQPATVVTGHGASHDVPVTVIARDPAVTARMSAWEWQDGLRPDGQAPVWPMDAFRDRFLATFSPPSDSAREPDGKTVVAPAPHGQTVRGPRR